MPAIRVVIQSRLNSSRLPGKAMLTIGGMPLIELVARRASRGTHQVVVATSEEQYDERIAAHLSSVGIPVVRGSLDDVLGRFVKATADLMPDDLVVRLTGDNPVADADLVDELVEATRASGHAYGRVDIEQVPEGIGAEVFTVADLRRAARTTTDPYDREHVTPWLRRTLGELLFVPKGTPGDVHAYRATVDTLGDYVRVADLFTDVEDPVAVTWVDLMHRLAGWVDAMGPRTASTTTRLGRLSRVVLSAREFDDGGRSEPAAHAESLRALIASAIDRGVTHIDVGRADNRAEDLLRATAEPALVKRFSVISRTGPLPEVPQGADAVAVEAAVERTFAALGRRSVDVLVFEGAADAVRGWERATAYREAGLIRSLGLVAHTLDDLRWALAAEGVDYVEVAAEAAEDTEVLPQLAAQGITLVTPFAEGRARAEWSTAVLVTSTDPDRLDEAIRAAQ
ncbi:flagellin modification protein FlmC [Intrasporangium oryzae NRRL B-24470]|uniref:Flagellin modification protein FlmC n=1 Tax=Intrasporangium oryzae NRRL B-24470 TaxID=1386089 RepID=W9G774_9MICO|nr:NTP transferase domain-containing protein [Intrasporangium oryzae]EWT01137.1 flagellin modification protein FlmC [Intrasporangium oryzae NRRL B-24470]